MKQIFVADFALLIFYYKLLNHCLKDAPLLTHEQLSEAGSTQGKLLLVGERSNMEFAAIVQSAVSKEHVYSWPPTIPRYQVSTQIHTKAHLVCCCI